MVYAAGEFASEDEGAPPYDLTEVVMLFVNGTLAVQVHTNIPRGTLFVGDFFIQSMC